MHLSCCDPIMYPEQANEPVYLDPDYVDFRPGITRLKLSSLPLFNPLLGLVSVFNAILVCIALWGIINGLVTAHQMNHAFSTEGVRHTGVIYSCHEYYKRERGVTYHYLSITYHYQVDSISYERTVRHIPERDCAQAEPGSAIPLTYLPNEPRRSRLDGENADFNLYPPIALILGVLVLLMLYACHRYLCWISLYHALTKHGRVQEGRVSSVEKKLDNDGRSRLVIHYHFQTPTGTRLKGKKETKKPDLLLRRFFFDKGRPIFVLYANDHAYMLL